MTDNPLDLILLIDDDEADNYYHTMVIGRAGVAREVTAFTRASDALEYLEGRDGAGRVSPDLILLDINMPAMNGWDFLEAVRQLDSFNESVVVIMLTTSLNPDDRARAEAIDVISGFMSKPLDSESLVPLIETYFKR